MTPLIFSFGLEELFSPLTKSFINVVQYFNTIIYMTDIILGFRKAFLNEKTGRECRDPNLIAQKYLKGYFIFDVLSTIPFDLFIDKNSDLSFLILFPLFKCLRLYRLKKIITYL